MTRVQPLLLAAALALVACGATPTATTLPAAVAVAPTGVAPAVGPRAAPVPGYLAPGALDVVMVLPAAPREGEARYESDRGIFRATRRFEGTPRWAMASDDALLGSADMLRHFSCALGLQLEPRSAPRTLRLLQRATRDAGQAMNVAKEHFQRKRPYWIDAGATCRPREELGDTFDYPSGHAMVGWTWAMVLAQLLPERTASLVARGRSIGESRIVCGVHNASAVDASRIAATAVFMLQGSQPEFRADLEAARAELAQLRASAPAPDPRACEAERALIAIPLG